ncbi:hypothetical protein ACMFMG_006319 [Clarireedia jacksonii]
MGKDLHVCPVKHFGFSCVFQDVVKKSNVSNDTYIRELEARIQELESQLQRQNEVAARTDMHENLQSEPKICIATPKTPLSGDLNNPTGNRLIAEYEHGEEEDTDARSATGSDEDQASYTLNASDDGGMRFYGPSSGFSVIPSQSNKSPENQGNKERWSSSIKRGLGLVKLSAWIPHILRDDLA